jgi:predicted Zn-dependent protease
LAFRLSSFALAASLLLATLSMPGGAAHAQSQNPVRLPALGEAEADELSIADERRLGDEIMREIKPDPDVIDDPVLTEYLDSIFQPLLNAARARGNISAEEDAAFAWEPFLVRDRSFNAFALPGGYIGVHLGLIASSGSSDEMASVLGHELSHVTQRHIARSMANSRKQTIASTVGMLLGLLAAARTSNPDIPMAVIASGQAAAATGQLSFSRDMEREADRFGLDVMTTAGFAPGGMASMFERLEAVSRLNDSNAYPYLRTHPLTIERLAEARLRAGDAQQPTSALNRPVEHQIMRERSRALMDPTEGPLRRMQDQGRHAMVLAPADKLGALYGAALASILLRDFPTAQVMIDQARQVIAGASATAGRSPTVANAAALASTPPAAVATAASGPEADAVMPAKPAPGTPLSETTSTAVGPPVDLASRNVRRDVALLQLQLAIAKRSTPEIIAASGALDPRDRSRPTMMAEAEAAVALAAVNDPGAPATLRRNIESLQTWVSEHRGDALAWTLLSECTDAAGQKLRSIRAEAEAHASQGDLRGAIDRLQAGQRLAKGPGTDFVEASIIDSRLRELEAQRRELNKDRKEPL